MGKDAAGAQRRERRSQSTLGMGFLIRKMWLEVSLSEAGDS